MAVTKPKLKAAKAVPPMQKRRYICTCCGKESTRQKNIYFSTKSELYKFNNGYLTMCTNCIKKYYDLLCKRYDDSIFAFYHLCSTFGWNFNEIAVKKAIAESIDPIGGYVKNMNVGICKGKTFDDNIMDYYNKLKSNENEQLVSQETIDLTEVENPKCQQLQEKIDELEAELEEVKGKIKEDNTPDISENKKKWLHKMEQRWGDGMKIYDYEYLEEEYEQWATIYGCKEKNMKTLVEEICLIKLTIRNNRAQGKPVDKDQRQLQEFLGACNLKPIQESSTNSEEQAMGLWIKHIEEDRPIPEPSEEFKDVDGIRKYFNWFLGHLLKVLGKESKQRQEYEKELEKYTVDMPPIEEVL